MSAGWADFRATRDKLLDEHLTEVRSTPQLAKQQQKALDVARALCRFGVPHFVARPDPQDLSQTGIGFFLPKGWQDTPANPHIIDTWRPGDALCAVGGIVADFGDVDVQSGGHLTQSRLIAQGLWPNTYGRARTPSGGTHNVMARTHVRKGKRDGIDFQAGDDNGQGRGFIFVAPTVKPSKITGEMLPYTWEIEPDLEALTAANGSDTSGNQFAAWIHEKIKKPRTGGNGTGPGNTPTAPIPDHEGHLTMVSYCGTLLNRHPDIALEAYVQLCRERWEMYEPGEAVWPWENCLANPVMDCWDRFERGEPREGPDEFQPDDNALILGEEFYAKRTVLKNIRGYAHDRCAGADSVLYATLARLAGMVPPQVRVDTGILSPASLNLDVAAVGPAGGGKTSSASLSKGLYVAPKWVDFPDGMPIGSGEGLIETYFDMVTVDDPSGATYSDGKPKQTKLRQQVRRNAFFVADEGQAMVKLMGRSGSTLGETIRSLWMGATAGQSNASADTRRILEEHTYSMGMFVGFQPGTVQPLLADYANGTPQRFLYCWVIDPTIPDEPAPAIPSSPFADAPEKFAIKVLPVTMCQAVKDEIRRTHLGRKQGRTQAPPLDGHDYLTKAKLSALLALMEGRHEVDEEDWALATEMYRVSCNVRNAMVEYGKAQNTREAAERNQSYATKEGLAESARQQARDNHGAPWRVARNIARKIHDKDLRTVGAVNRTLKRDDQKNRSLVDGAWEIAIDEGWVVRDGNDVQPGGQKPA